MTSFILIFIFLLLLILFFLIRDYPDVIFFSRTVSKYIFEQYSSDLTYLAREKRLDPVVGREKEIQRVIQILMRRTKDNPILLGKAGIGKTAIVEGLAQRIASGKAPKQLLNKRVLALDLGDLVAGTKYRGEFEKRLQIFRDEIIKAKRQIILFIDEVHNLAEAGGAIGAIDAAEILKPALARGDLQVIGATTVDDYNKYIKTNKTLDRRFQPILISEPTPEQALVILKGLKETYEKYHQVKISEEALKTTIKLSEEISNRCFPDKAIDLIDEACAKVSLANPRLTDKKVAEVKPKDIEETIKQWPVI